MYYAFPPTSPYSQLLLPFSLIEKLPSINEDELKILLYLHAHAAKNRVFVFSDEEAVRLLADKGYDEKAVQNAVAYLRGAGLLLDDKVPPKKHAASAEHPYYTSEQLAQVCETSSDFNTLKSFAEERLGKIFNTSDLAVLYSFTDSLCLSCDVIMLVIEYCASIDKPSLRYVGKMLEDLCKKELTSYEAVERHLTGIKEYKTYEGKIRRLCGLGERALTKKEAAIVSHWKTELKASFELIEAAYERTVAAIGEPKLPYIGKILEKWHENGIRSPDEIENAPAAEKLGGFDTDDFFQAAVAKSRGTKRKQ